MAEPLSCGLLEGWQFRSLACSSRQDFLWDFMPRIYPLRKRWGWESSQLACWSSTAESRIRARAVETLQVFWAAATLIRSRVRDRQNQDISRSSALLDHSLRFSVHMSFTIFGWLLSVLFQQIQL
mmetsp:Transcript_148168/g.283946  ORF Transcript_148168/g.283946 Transcript_148168/m.283946 type:complete len:125 (+) Transcript_148168:988-1362(+)